MSWTVTQTVHRASCDGVAIAAVISPGGERAFDYCADYDLWTGERRMHHRTSIDTVSIASSDTWVRAHGQTLSIEPQDDRHDIIVLRDASHEICRQRVAAPPHPRNPSALSNGRFVVFAAEGCTAHACASAGLFAVSPRCALSPLLTIPTVIAAAGAPGGARGVVVARDGARVVALPSGRRVADLPLALAPTAGVGEVSIALDALAEHVAVLEPGGLHVFEHEGASYVSRFDAPWPSGVAYLTWVPGRRELVVDDTLTMTVLRATP